MALAVRLAPDEPIAWEQWVADAAFNRYLRDASTGRRRNGAAARWRAAAGYSARRMTIWSSSIVTVTGRWPAQCSAYTGSSTTAGSSHSP